MKRPGSGTVYTSIWDIDVFDFIDIKKKHGDERTRAKDLFNALIIDDVFMERMINDEEYTLFDPKDVSDLIETYGDDFKQRYIKYEYEFQKNPLKFNINTKIIKAKDLAIYFITSYYENGVPFLFFKDNVNKQHKHPELGIIRSSNLCCFTGETLVALPDEDNKGLVTKTIRQLAEESNGVNKFKVYSGKKDESVPSKWSIEVKDAVAFKSGTKKIKMVVLENGDIFKCTPDHKFALYGGGYIDAENSVGMKIMSYPSPKNKGYGYLTVLGVHNDPDDNEYDVYDLTVEDNHNFYIITHRGDDEYQCDVGILVHNCEIAIPTDNEHTAVCNLGSINLAKTNTEEDLRRVTSIAIRSMDNCIDLTVYPSKESERSQREYRSIGLGMTGEAEYIATNFIEYGSDKHKEEVERIYSTIQDQAYITTKALAKEKGSCVISGHRNAYLMAIAPNSSSGLLASTTNSHEPVYAKIWTEGTKYDSFKLTAPNINKENAEYYKTPFEIPINTQIEMNSIRQKYIDMAISFNLYIEPKTASVKVIKDAIVECWKKGLKTTYYLRSKGISNDNVNEVGLLKQKGDIKCVGCEN